MGGSKPSFFYGLLGSKGTLSIWACRYIIMAMGSYGINAWPRWIRPHEHRTGTFVVHNFRCLWVPVFSESPFGYEASLWIFFQVFFVFFEKIIWPKNCWLFRLYRGWSTIPSSVWDYFIKHYFWIPIYWTTRIQWKVSGRVFVRGSIGHLPQFSERTCVDPRWKHLEIFNQPTTSTTYSCSQVSSFFRYSLVTQCIPYHPCVGSKLPLFPNNRGWSSTQ